MIVRMWYPSIRKGMEEQYERIVREEGAPFVSSRPGCLSFNLVKSQDDPSQYVVVSKWESEGYMKAMVNEDRYIRINEELAKVTDGEAVTRIFDVVV